MLKTNSQINSSSACSDNGDLTSANQSCVRNILEEPSEAFLNSLCEVHGEHLRETIKIESNYIEINGVKWSRKFLSSDENISNWLEKNPNLANNPLIGIEDLKHCFTKDEQEKIAIQNKNKLRITSKSDYENLLKSIPGNSEYEKGANIIALFDLKPTKLITKLGSIEDFGRPTSYIRTSSQAFTIEDKNEYLVVSFPKMLWIRTDRNLDDYGLQVMYILIDN